MRGKKEKVRSYYDSFAKDYNNFYEKIQYEKFKFVLTDFDDEFFESCIDVGGGTGLLSKYLNREIFTVDLSYDMIKEALKLKHSKILLVADMTALPIRKSAFKIVFSFTAIQNAIYPINMVKEVFRILRSEAGNFLITTLEKIIDDSKFKIICEEGGLVGNLLKFPIEDIGFSNFC